MTRVRNDSGAALAEAAIAIMLLLILTTGLLNVGPKIREGTIAVEASRHGARSAGARSGELSPLLLTQDIQGYYNQPAQRMNCGASSPSTTSPILRSALVGTCKFIIAAHTAVQESSHWEAAARILSSSEGGHSVYYVEVEADAVQSSPLVRWFGQFLDVRPRAVSRFPVEGANAA